jgi:hypothetical protein
MQPAGQVPCTGAKQPVKIPAPTSRTQQSWSGEQHCSAQQCVPPPQVVVSQEGVPQAPFAQWGLDPVHALSQRPQ